MFALVNGVSIYYEIEGNGKAIVCCHGNGGDHTNFEMMKPFFLDKFQMVMPDSRGHGQSTPASQMHYRELAEDIAALIRELHLEKPYFLGISDGGIIGLLIAASYPDLLGALVVCGANTVPKGLQTKDHVLIHFMYLIKHDPKIKMILKEPDISMDELHKIKAPTLVLAGDHDLIKTSHTREIARNIPNAKITVFPGETHVSYLVENNKGCKAALDFFHNCLRGESH